MTDEVAEFSTGHDECDSDDESDALAESIGASCDDLAREAARSGFTSVTFVRFHKDLIDHVEDDLTEAEADELLAEYVEELVERGYRRVDAEFLADSVRNEAGYDGFPLGGPEVPSGFRYP